MRACAQAPSNAKPQTECLFPGSSSSAHGFVHGVDVSLVCGIWQRGAWALEPDGPLHLLWDHGLLT